MPNNTRVCDECMFRRDITFTGPVAPHIYPHYCAAARNWTSCAYPTRPWYSPSLWCMSIFPAQILPKALQDEIKARKKKEESDE